MKSRRASKTIRAVLLVVVFGLSEVVFAAYGLQVTAQEPLPSPKVVEKPYDFHQKGAKIWIGLKGGTAQDGEQFNIIYANIRSWKPQWTQSKEDYFSVTFVEAEFPPPVGFAQVNGVVLGWRSALTGNSAEGLGVVRQGTPPNEPADLHPSHLSFKVVLPQKGHATQAAILNESKQVILGKSAILGVLDLSKASGDKTLSSVLSEVARQAEQWDVGIYEWRDNSTEIRFVNDDQGRTPVRIYLFTGKSSQDVKSTLDRLLITYYSLAAAEGDITPSEKRTLETLAKRVSQEKAVDRFLKVYSQGKLK